MARIELCAVLLCLAACADREAFVLTVPDTCGMQLNDAGVAFCERFTGSFSGTGKSGALEGSRWSVSRLGGDDNLGQGEANGWAASTLVTCSGSQPAQADNTDLAICNGQLRESSNDNGGPTRLALEVKQPFDFANRTGTIAFDVTNDTTGSHGTWPALWISDEPVPAPTIDFPPCLLCSLPRNGVGFSFSGALPPYAGPQQPNCPGDANWRWVVDVIVIVRDYTVQTIGYGPDPGEIQTQGCPILASGPDGPPNHIEVQIAQNQLEVWATDPGSRELKPVALLPDAGLTFTQGFVTLEDAHFDARQSSDAGSVIHTYSWSNVAFDGPVLPGMLTFDVPDALVANQDGTLNLGWKDDPSSPVTLSTPPISELELAAATEALLVFQFNPGPIATFNASINGHAISMASPFSPDMTYWHSVALPVPLSSLAPGSQTVSVWGDQIVDLTNVSVVLLGAAGSGGFGVGCESAPGTFSAVFLALALLRRRRPDF